jgi:hypothetical protein
MRPQRRKLQPPQQNEKSCGLWKDPHSFLYMGNRMQMRSNCVLIGIKQGQVVQCKQKG